MLALRVLPRHQIQLDKNQDTKDTGDPPPSGPIVARFTSRKVTARVTGARQDSRTALRNQDIDAPQYLPGKVCIADDLAQRRDRLSCKAQVLTWEGKIVSTWLFGGRVLFKDHHNHIHATEVQQSTNNHT